MKKDRLMSITLLLLERGKITALELSEIFEVSLRTIYRDIDAIDLAGVPILSTPGANGGFQIMPNYKIDKNVFTTSELSTILMGIFSLSEITQDAELLNALSKVKSLIPPDKANDIEIKSQQIHIDLSSWFGNKNIQSYLEIIRDSIDSHTLLRFTYRDRFGNTSTRNAEPYQLILKGTRWYWYGYCLDRADYRLFRLSRMSNLELTNEHFEIREFSQPQLDYTEYLTSLQSTVKIRIHRSILDNVLDYCSVDDFTPDGDDHFIVNFPFVENDYYYNLLLGFGDKCVCLSPLKVRDSLRRRIEKLSALYSI